MTVSEHTRTDPPPSLEAFAGRACLVLGAARSGLAAVEQLRRVGARITLYDRDPQRLEHAPLDIATESGSALPSFSGFDWIIQSPGVPVAADPRVVPEVDLAFLSIHARLIGITGTNGKSTTTALIAAMLEQSGIPTSVGGNLGTPLCHLADQPADWCVVELSSFQLEHARWIRPHVAVLLNLADDHLDRHGSLEHYGAAKARLAELLEPHGTLVFNLDDPWAAEVAARSHLRGALGFSTRVRPTRGAYLDGEDLVLAPTGSESLRLSLGLLSPSLRAHPANVLAALLAGFAAGGNPERIARAARGFEGLAHRMQRVLEVDGITYINDSKATNPAAALASLENLREPVIWLAGGSNKGLRFDTLRGALSGVRLAIVYGQAARDLEAALGDATEVRRVETLREAIALAAEHARPGDSVLLSPACASFDQFDNFEHRGECFTRWAKEVTCSR